MDDNMPADPLERVLDKLDKIDTKLGEFRDEMHDFQQNADSRLAVLEERCAKEKIEAVTERISELEEFKARAGVYMAISGSIGTIVGGIAIKLILGH